MHWAILPLVIFQHIPKKSFWSFWSYEKWISIHGTHGETRIVPLQASNVAT